jgi:hypothetical protein
MGTFIITHKTDLSINVKITKNMAKQQISQQIRGNGYKTEIIRHKDLQNFRYNKNIQDGSKDMNFSSSVMADLAIIMIIAAVTVYIFYRLKQPMIIGYLIAGIIIGPFTPPFALISYAYVFSATADMGGDPVIIRNRVKIPRPATFPSGQLI